MNHTHIQLQDVARFIDSAIGKTPLSALSASEFVMHVRSCPTCREMARWACSLLLPDTFLNKDPTTNTDDCPSNDDLAAFIDGNISDAEAEEHVRLCAACQLNKAELLSFAEIMCVDSLAGEQAPTAGLGRDVEIQKRLLETRRVPENARELLQEASLTGKRIMRLDQGNSKIGFYVGADSALVRIAAGGPACTLGRINLSSYPGSLNGSELNLKAAQKLLVLKTGISQGELIDRDDLRLLAGEHVLKPVKQEGPEIVFDLEQVWPGVDENLNMVMFKVSTVEPNLVDYATGVYALRDTLRLQYIRSLSAVLSENTAVTVLSQLLRNENPDVATAAAETLGGIVFATAVRDLLFRAADDPILHPDVRAAARQALTKSPS